MIELPSEMVQELDRLRATLHQAASERGLVVFDGEPDVSKLASVAWQGDWPAFLDLAQQAHALLLYVREQRYDPDTVISEESGDPDLISDETNNAGTTASTAESERESKAWLLARIWERIAPWEARRGEVISMSCVWVKDHVAHHWRRYADWVFDCREAIDIVLEEAELIEREDRTLRSQEAARKLHEYATQMARHPRFPEATSEEKREFMASQLFPDLTNDDLLGYRGCINKISYAGELDNLRSMSRIEAR